MADWCRRTLLRLVDQLSLNRDTDTMIFENLEAVENQVEIVYRELACMEAFGLLGDEENETALDLIAQALLQLQTIKSTVSRSNVSTYETAILRNGFVGRPRYYIPRSLLEFLLQKKFSVPKVASLLNVSVRTVRRRMEQYEIFVHNLYSSISDYDLDNLVRRIHQQFGSCGNRQTQGHLLAQGHRIQQSRIRESQRRVDPGGCLMRRLGTINRRKYNVNGPLALWHIDGNHKLIKYVN